MRRSRSPPTTRARTSPTWAGRVASRAGGERRRHRPRAGPLLRRHRVPRLRPGHGRGVRRQRRRAGVERADRPVAPHPDARRHPDHDRAPPVGDVSGHRLLLPGRRPQQRRPLAARHRRAARAGRADRRAPRALAARRRAGDRDRPRRSERRHDHRHRRRPTPGSTAPASSTPMSGSAWARPTPSGPPGPAADALPGHRRGDGGHRHAATPVHALPARRPRHDDRARSPGPRRVRSRRGRGHRRGLRLRRHRSSSTRPRTGCTPSRRCSSRPLAS